MQVYTILYIFSYLDVQVIIAPDVNNGQNHITVRVIMNYKIEILLHLIIVYVFFSVRFINKIV